MGDPQNISKKSVQFERCIRKLMYTVTVVDHTSNISVTGLNTTSRPREIVTVLTVQSTYNMQGKLSCSHSRKMLE